MQLGKTLLLASFMVACAESPRTQEGSQFKLQLERGPCFGNCPRYILSVDSNGDVTYEEGSSSYPSGWQNRKEISRRDVNRLIESIEQSSFFTVDDPTCEFMIDDETSFWLEITYQRRHRRVFRHLGCGPDGSDSVVELADFVDEVVKTHQLHRATIQ